MKRPSTSRRTYREFKRRPRVFSQIKVDYIDYKDVELLKRFISDRSKIRGRALTGNTMQEQRAVAQAIKNAREMALLPFTSQVTSQRLTRSYGGYRDEYEDEREAEAYTKLTKQSLKEEEKKRRVTNVGDNDALDGAGRENNF